MRNVKILRNVEPDVKIDSICGECRRETKHLILVDVEREGCEQDENNYFDWSDKYQVIQCQGCESIVFREVHENSEDYDYVVHNGTEGIVPIRRINIHPNPEKGRNLIKDYFLIPKSLQAIYKETISALNYEHLILTGVGIRAIIETICKDKSAQGSSLLRKIDDLVEQGVLTKDGSIILHKLRSLGNSAAHEVKPHDIVQLGLAVDVIDNLIKSVYIIPHHAKTTFADVK